MGRNRLVQPGVVRLQIADVYRREHERLIKHGVVVGKKSDGQFRPATQEEIAESAARHAAAVDDDDWVEVKRELNAGESRDASTRLYHEWTAGERAKIRPEQIGLATIVAYLTAWSFEDPRGNVIDLGFTPEDRESAIRSLDTLSYAELEAAVDAHEDTIVTTKNARKNVKGDESKFLATSSPVV